MAKPIVTGSSIYDYQIYLPSTVCKLPKNKKHCNWTRTHNHLVHKWALNHLAKMASLAKCLSVRLWTKWLWVRNQLQSLKLQISHLHRARSSLTFLLQSMDWNTYVIWQEHTVKCRIQISADYTAQSFKKASFA